MHKNYGIGNKDYVDQFIGSWKSGQFEKGTWYQKKHPIVEYNKFINIKTFRKITELYRLISVTTTLSDLRHKLVHLNEESIDISITYFPQIISLIQIILDNISNNYYKCIEYPPENNRIESCKHITFMSAILPKICNTATISYKTAQINGQKQTIDRTKNINGGNFKIYFNIPFVISFKVLEFDGLNFKIRVSGVIHNYFEIFEHPNIIINKLTGSNEFNGIKLILEECNDYKIIKKNKKYECIIQISPEILNIIINKNIYKKTTLNNELSFEQLNPDITTFNTVNNNYRLFTH